jgi:hypothetical protein
MKNRNEYGIGQTRSSSVEIEMSDSEVSTTVSVAGGSIRQKKVSRLPTRYPRGGTNFMSRDTPECGGDAGTCFFSC